MYDAELLFKFFLFLLLKIYFTFTNKVRIHQYFLHAQILTELEKQFSENLVSLLCYFCNDSVLPWTMIIMQNILRNSCLKTLFFFLQSGSKNFCLPENCCNLVGNPTKSFRERIQIVFNSQLRILSSKNNGNRLQNLFLFYFFFRLVFSLLHLLMTESKSK